MRAFYLPYIFFAALITVIFGSCTKEYEGIEAEDEKTIQEYIRQNNLNVQEYDTTGIFYQILEEGTGEEVDYQDVVFITFTVRTTDGLDVSSGEFSNYFSDYLGYFGPRDNINNSLYPEAFRISVKEILKRKGGSIRIIIPSGLAYGKDGYDPADIPGNASLDCTITLYDADDRVSFEDGLISRFADVNDLTLTKDSSGIHYQVITPGSGSEQLTDSTEVTVKYTLRFLDGRVLPQTGSDSYKSKLGNNIPGFQAGVRLLQKGGKMRLLLPSRLGYGTAGSGDRVIPTNTILDYDIELLEVTN